MLDISLALPYEIGTIPSEEVEAHTGKIVHQVRLLTSAAWVHTHLSHI